MKEEEERERDFERGGREINGFLLRRKGDQWLLKEEDKIGMDIKLGGRERHGSPRR